MGVLEKLNGATQIICLPWNAPSEDIDHNLGPVVQSIVSLTTSLRRQLLKYMPTKLSHTLLFWTAKDSNIFSTKNNSVFVIFTFENLTKR